MKSHKAMILFTVFNERLVKMYLNSKIYYGDITKILIKMTRSKSERKTWKIYIKDLRKEEWVVFWQKRIKQKNETVENDNVKAK